MLLKNRQLIHENTGWISPNNAVGSGTYGEGEWLNLDNILYYNDHTYATIPEGVTTEVKGQTITCTDFEYELPENVDIESIDVRIRVLDSTNGGGGIRDHQLIINNTMLDKINQQAWDEEKATENIYTLQTDTLPEDITVQYQITGTGTYPNKPYIYGLQIKINYNYYDDISYEETTLYETNATITRTLLKSLSSLTVLRINRHVLNSMSGLYGALIITLSDELQFSDGATSKTIPATNTTELWDNTLTYNLKPVKAGLGTIIINGSSLNEEIILYCLVDTTNLYNDHFTNLDENIFINNTATSRGGGIYNNSFLNNNNPYYQGNTATVEGANVYNAKTRIKPNIQESYEKQTVVTFSCNVYVENNNLNKTVNNGTVSLYVNGTEKLTSNVVNGVATFTTNQSTFPTTGEKIVKFAYSGYTTEYGPSDETAKVTITPKNTQLSLVNDRVQQYTYLKVKLLDSSNQPVIDETVNIQIGTNNYARVTDDEGIAYLMITMKPQTVMCSISFNGNDDYNESILDTSFIVSLQKLEIVSDDLYCRKGITEYYNFKVTDEAGSALPGMKVKTVLKDSGGATKVYENTSNNAGTISIPISLSSGVWTATNTFTSDNVFASVTCTDEIVVYNTGSAETKITLDEQVVEGIRTSEVHLKGNLSDVVARNGLTGQPVYIIITNKGETVSTPYKTTTDKYANYDFAVKLGVGNYTYKAVYLGTEAYDGCVESGTINISDEGNTPTIIESYDLKYNVKENTTYTIQLTDENQEALTDRTIVFDIKKGDTTWFKYVATTNEYGYAYYDLGLTEGVYTIETNFSGDKMYQHCINKNTIIVEGYGTAKTYLDFVNETLANSQKRVGFRLTNDQGNALNNIYCNLLCYDNLGTVIVKESPTNKEGVYYSDFTNTPGFMVLDAWFVGNMTYAPTLYSTCLYIPKNEGTKTSLSGVDLEVYDGEEHYYVATLKVGQDVLKGVQVVTEVINSDKSRKYYFNTTDDNGQIRLRVDWGVDVYQVRSYYAPKVGNSYRSCTCENVVNVLQNKNLIPTVIVGEDTSQSFVSTDTFDVTLSTVIDSEPLPYKSVTFEMVNKDTGERNIYTAITDSNGVASLELTEYAGDYTCNYTFLGDRDYNQSLGTNTIHILTTHEYETVIESYDTTLEYSEDNGGNVNMKLLNQDTGLSNKEIIGTFIHKVTHEVISLTKTTNNAGRANFNTTGFIVGEYDVTLEYGGDMDYAPSTKNLNLTITPQDELTPILATVNNEKIDTSLGDDPEIIVTFAGDSDQVDLSELVGDYVVFDFYDRQNKRYSFMSTIDSYYKATFSLSNVNAGVYDVYITYPVQTVYTEVVEQIWVNIEKQTPILTLEDQSISYFRGESIEATLTDGDGVVLSNHYVIFNIGNSVAGYRNYNALTNDEGVAKVYVDYPVGDYEVQAYNVETMKYTRVNAKCNISVTTATNTLSVPTKSYYYGDQVYYRVRLLSYNQPVPEVTVKLVANGQEYSNNTSEQGYADYILNLIENGQYTITASINDPNFVVNTTNGQVNIIRKPVTLTLSDLNEEQHVTASLIDVKGQAVNDAELQITISEIEEDDED